MVVKSFRDLEIWKQAKEVAVRIYKITNTKMFMKDYSLKDQIRRSAVSISSNIAEGFERGNKEFGYFLKISKGSVSELMSQLEIGKDIGYINISEHRDIDEDLNILNKRIGKLITYLNKKIS